MKASVDFSLQRELFPTLQGSSATVVGCGGMGIWVSFLLATAGASKLRIYAPGTVKDTDPGRCPLPPNSVGSQRGQAITELLTHLRPDLQLEIRSALDLGGKVEFPDGPVFNCASGPNGFDEELARICFEGGHKYVTGFYSGMHWGAFPDASMPIAPSLDPVPTSSINLAFLAAVLVTTAYHEIGGHISRLDWISQIPNSNPSMFRHGLAR